MCRACCGNIEEGFNQSLGTVKKSFRAAHTCGRAREGREETQGLRSRCRGCWAQRRAPPGWSLGGGKVGGPDHKGAVGGGG